MTTINEVTINKWNHIKSELQFFDGVTRTPGDHDFNATELGEAYATVVAKEMESDYCFPKLAKTIKELGEAIDEDRFLSAYQDKMEIFSALA